MSAGTSIDEVCDFYFRNTLPMSAPVSSTFLPQLAFVLIPTGSDQAAEKQWRDGVPNTSLYWWKGKKERHRNI